MTKSKAGRPPLKNKPRKTSVKDKVEGALEKVVGTVEGRPGKKVRFFFLFFSSLFLPSGVEEGEKGRVYLTLKEMGVLFAFAGGRGESLGHGTKAPKG